MNRTRDVRVLLTGFEPFGGEALNPSQQVVRSIAGGGAPGVDLHTAVLPVDRRRAARVLLAQVHAAAPHAVILLGEAGGRARVTPERIAINVDDYAMADNAGHRPRDEAVIAGGPAGYFSTLPLRRMVAGLKTAGIPAEISNSAGTFLCNHVFYTLMHHLAGDRAAPAAGFVHLPYLHEQVRDKPGAVASMSLDTLVGAVRVIIETATAAR